MGKTVQANAGRTDEQAGRGHKGAAPDHKAAEVDLRFSLLFSALYHDGCERSLMRRHRALTALNLVLGSGAAVAISAQHSDVAQFMALAVAVIGAVQLVWDFGGTARDHAALREEFYRLMADLKRGRAGTEIEADMTALYGREPTIIERERRRAHDKAGASLYGDSFTKA